VVAAKPEYSMMPYWILLQKLAEKRESAGIGGSNAGLLQCMYACWQAFAMLHGPRFLLLPIATNTCMFSGGTY